MSKKNPSLADLAAMAKGRTESSPANVLEIDLDKGQKQYLAEIQSLLACVEAQCKEGEDPGKALNAMLISTSQFVGELIPGITIGALTVFLGAVVGFEIGATMHTLNADEAQQAKALEEATMQMHTSAAETIPRAREMVEKIEEAQGHKGS